MKASHAKSNSRPNHQQKGQDLNRNRGGRCAKDGLAKKQPPNAGDEHHQGDKRRGLPVHRIDVITGVNRRSSPIASQSRKWKNADDGYKSARTCLAVACRRDGRPNHRPHSVQSNDNSDGGRPYSRRFPSSNGSSAPASTSRSWKPTGSSGSGSTLRAR